MTKVSFLKSKDGDLMAYFPDEIYNEVLYNKTLKTCYAHIGQHSACHVNYARGCRKAEPSEYKPLLNELVSIGYNDLVIL